MPFLVDLVRSKDSAYSAYLSYITGKDREGFRFFAFVEDDADIFFYQHVLSHDCDIKFVSCGGKTNVFSVFHRLQAEAMLDHALFFVDKDLEQRPFPEEKLILRTTGYSWESHCVSLECVERILGRRMLPMASFTVVNDWLEAWKQTLENFRILLAQQIAAISFAHSRGNEAGVSELVFTKNFYSDEYIVAPHADCVEEMETALTDMIGSDDDRETLSFVIREAVENREFADYRGKNLYHVFKAFIANLLRNIPQTCGLDYASPAAAILILPFTSPQLKYIHDYVAQRRR